MQYGNENKTQIKKITNDSLNRTMQYGNYYILYIKRLSY